jgi:hypothetical protein
MAADLISEHESPSTREIPRSQWAGFCDRFSRQHGGWLVTIELLGAETGAQVEVRNLPLKGITAEMKNSGPDVISVVVGSTPREHVAHTVAEPRRIWVEETQNGAHAALEIESFDDTKTLVRFRSAMRPELVDGLTEDKKSHE